MSLAGTLSKWSVSARLGSDWSAVGYEGAQGHLDACRTWAWEQSIFEKEALESGLIETLGWLENTWSREPICSRIRRPRAMTTRAFRG